MIIPINLSFSSPAAYIAQGRFSATKSVYVVTPNKRVDIDYLVHILDYVNLRQYASDAPVLRLSKSILEGVKIPVPSLVEQKQLVSYLAKLKAYVEEVKSLYQVTLAELESLVPVTLAEVFNGRQ